MHVEDDGETLEVVSPSGDVEVGIRLTPEGPVLKLRGARLEIDSTETVAINCRRFELNADEVLELRAGAGVAVQSDADIQFRSEGQTHIDGDWVNINCDERAGTGWHDDPLLLEAGGGDPEAESLHESPGADAEAKGSTVGDSGDPEKAGK